MNVSPPSRIRVHNADRGMTLIELIIAIALSTMIGGVIVAALITSLNVSSATSEQVSDSTDAGLIASFLTRDAQSAGGLDPANALPDGTGVSTDPSDADGIACAGQPLVLKVRFSWIDRSASAEAKVVVSYALDGERQLVRRICTNGVDTDVVMGRNVSSARATCVPAPATEFCSGHPTFVSLTVEGSGSRAPFLYTLTASLRSAISQLTIVGPASLPAGQRGAVYMPTQMTTIGAVGASTWSATGLPLGLEIDPVTGVIWGTVDASVRGSFDVTITVTDTSPTTATRLYTIAILAPPEAVPDAYSVNEDSILSVPAPGVLTNDSSDGTKTAILYSGVANGALAFRSDGSFTYTPRTNFNGTDLFMYKVTDGSLGSNIVTVTLTVNPVNDAPINRVPVAQRTLKNVSKVFVNSSRISISDVDAGDAIVQVQLNAANGNLTLPGATGLVSSVGSGTAAMTITGTVANLNLSLANATLTPNTDFIGAAALQIVTNDLGKTGTGGELADTDSIDIAVTDSALGVFTDKADISAPFKPGDSTFADPNYTVSNGKGELGGNADGLQFLFRSLTGDGRLTARVLTFDANGNGAQAGVMFRETLDVGSSHATIDITNKNKAEFLYRPGAGQTTTLVSYPGPAAPYWLRLTRLGNVFTAERSADGVTWVASSPTTITMASTIYIGLAVAAHSNSDNLATAVFDQVAITTPPSAFADAYSVNEDTTLVVDVDNGVLANDSDPEGESLSAAIVTSLAGLTLNADGSFTYVPPANFTGTASFTYKANDAALSSPPTTVILTVDPANESPSFVKGANQIVAADAGVQVVAGWATAISQGSGETDQLIDFIVVNSDNSIFSVQPVLSADGTLTYALAAGPSGSAIVSVSIHDNGGTANGGADTSAVQTFVIAVNEAPVAAADNYSVNEDTTLTVPVLTGVLANDTDPQGTPLTATFVSGTTVTFNSNGSFTYVPPANFNGTASFTYKANDGSLDSNVVTATLTVVAVNDAPSFTKGTNQSVAANSPGQTVAGWATPISQGTGDTGQVVDFIVTNSNNPIFSVQPAVSASGTLTYTPAPNATGVATVSVRIHDTGGTANGGVDTSAVQTFTITIPDTIGPAGGSVDASGLLGTGARYSKVLTLSIVLNKGVDPSGLAPTGALLNRATAALTSSGTADGVCGTFGTYALVSGGTDPASPKSDSVPASGCYKYQYVVKDTIGNSTTYTSPEIKVDTTAPNTSALVFSAFTKAYWSGSGTIVYFNSSAGISGSFTATATASDTASGILDYAFPALGTNWTSTPGALGVHTYSWTSGSANPGLKNVTATNNATGTSTSPFTPTRDTTIPAGGAVSYLNGSQTSTTISVTFTTSSDTGSGIATRLLQRAFARLNGTACEAYTAFATVATNPASPLTDTVAHGFCYKYQYVVTDNVGNVDTNTSNSVTKNS